MYKNMSRDLLIARIMELEEQVEHLRISRRVLMNLIEKIEKEKKLFLLKLETENRRLQKNNTKYARRIWEKNRELMKLVIKTQQKG